jgi:hypothetical protein
MSAGAASLIVADGHTHVYPFHDRTRALDALGRGLNRLAGPAPDRGERIVRVACLIESNASGVFGKLVAQSEAEPGREGAVEPCAEPQSVRIRPATGEETTVVAGRQVTSEERLEILALGTVEQLEDGAPAAQLVRELRGRAVPALNWAPGKWFGARGGVVARLLAEFGPADLVVCDTALRPVGWGEPRLMRAARARGFKVIAGSDPLPLPGEESRVGSYGFRVEGAWDSEYPARSLAALLLRSDAVVHRVGRRGSLPSVSLRILRHMLR